MDWILAAKRQDLDNAASSFNSTIKAGRRTIPISSNSSSDSGFDIVRVELSYLFR